MVSSCRDGCKTHQKGLRAVRVLTFLPLAKPAAVLPSEAERTMCWRPACSPCLASASRLSPSVLDAFLILALWVWMFGELK